MIDKNADVVPICGGSLVEIQPLITADSRFLICGNGNKISIFSCANGERCRVFKGHDTKVVAIFQMGENSNKIISGSSDGKIIVWSYEDGTIEKSFKIGRNLVYFHLVANDDDDHDDPKTCYAVVKKDDEEKMELMQLNIPQKSCDETATTEILVEVECQPHMLAFGAQNSIFVQATNKQLKVFKLKTKEMFCHKSYQKITCIACHPNENVVATGMRDGKIVMWRDACGPRPINSEYHWHSLSLKTIHFSLDGASLYSGGYECVLAMWNLIDMRKSLLPRLGSPICRLASSVDGSLVAVCNVHNGIQLVDSSFKVVQMIQGFAQVCNEIPETGTQNIHLDTKTGLLFSVGIPGHLQFYDPIKDSHVFNLDVTKENYTSPENLSSPTPLTSVTHASLGEDGTWLVTAQSLSYPCNVRVETALKFWKRNAGGFEFHGKYEMEDVTVTSLASRNYRKAGFVPMFATTTSDGTLSTWEFVYDEDCSGKARQMWRHGFSSDYRNPKSCSFSCDGSTLGVVHDKCLTLWNVMEQRREMVLSLFGEKEIPEAIVFGQKFHSNVFYVSTDKHLRCWSLKKNERWMVSLGVRTMICKKDTEDLIVFTVNSTIEIFNPQSSSPSMSLNLTVSRPVVSACFKERRLLFLTDNRELFTLNDGDVEMACDEATGDEPTEINFLSNFTTYKGGAKDDLLNLPHAVDKALMFSDKWGDTFLEMITPKWKTPREFTVFITDDIAD